MSLRRKLVSRAFRDVHLLAGAFLAFCGTVLVLNAADMALDYRDALELKAALIAKDMVRADTESQKGTRFVARYRVLLPDGQTHEAEEDLPRADWEARAIGSEHTVLYLSSSGKTLPGAASDRAGVAIMGAIGLVLLGGGLLLARAPARRLLERLRVARSGTLASAIVLDVFQTSTAVNRVILWQLRYRYRSPGGTELEGESELLRPEEAAAWRAGAEGEILVDPDRPEASCAEIAWSSAARAPITFRTRTTRTTSTTTRSIPAHASRRRALPRPTMHSSTSRAFLPRSLRAGTSISRRPSTPASTGSSLRSDWTSRSIRCASRCTRSSTWRSRSPASASRSICPPTDEFAGAAASTRA